MNVDVHKDVQESPENVSVFCKVGNIRGLQKSTENNVNTTHAPYYRDETVIHFAACTWDLLNTYKIRHSNGPTLMSSSFPETVTVIKLVHIIPVCIFILLLRMM